MGMVDLDKGSELHLIYLKGNEGNETIYKE